MMEEKDYSEIQRFYDGKKVFITGGTGFMGKILIEKLIRSTNVSTIYLLIREKKGKNLNTRIDELFDNIIFDKIKKEKRGFKHKIIGVSGDCTIPELGISIEDQRMLIENVDIVFHVAATVRFDEHLRLAYNINVNGTSDCLNLCKRMKNLKVFMHVSTAYSNCIYEKIEEKFYDCPIDCDEVGMLLNKMTDADIEELTPKIIGKWPNTYSFTKGLAEALIRERGNGIPIGVYRPAVVISTYKEPIKGWIDNLYGPTGVCAGVASGVLRTLHCDGEVVANIVPVDTCVAGLIAAAWDVAGKTFERKAENIPIYNYVSCTENPITWDEFNLLNFRYGLKFPLSKCIWAIRFRTTKDEGNNLINRLFYHYVPAIAMDSFACLFGQKPRLLKMYRKIDKFTQVINYFCMRNWVFTNDNLVHLWERMNDTDKELFPFSITRLHWLAYFKTYISGLREYLMKDPIENVEDAKRRHHRFQIAHYAIKYTLYFVSAHVVVNQLFKLFNFFTGFCRQQKKTELYSIVSFRLSVAH